MNHVAAGADKDRYPRAVPSAAGTPGMASPAAGTGILEHGGRSGAAARPGPGGAGAVPHVDGGPGGEDPDERQDAPTGAGGDALGPGSLLTSLATLPAAAILDEEALARAFGVTARSVRRMVGRYELPPAVPLGGRSVWLAGGVLDWLRARANRAAESVERRAEAYLRQAAPVRARVAAVPSGAGRPLVTMKPRHRAGQPVAGGPAAAARTGTSGAVLGLVVKSAGTPLAAVPAAVPLAEGAAPGAARNPQRISRL